MEILIKDYFVQLTKNGFRLQNLDELGDFVGKYKWPKLTSKDLMAADVKG